MTAAPAATETEILYHLRLGALTDFQGVTAIKSHLSDFSYTRAEGKLPQQMTMTEGVCLYSCKPRRKNGSADAKIVHDLSVNRLYQRRNPLPGKT